MLVPTLRVGTLPAALRQGTRSVLIGVPTRSVGTSKHY